MHDLTGKITGVSFSYETGNPVIAFEMQEKKTTLDMVDTLRHYDKLSIKVGKFSKKRTLDANSYYWLLLGKLSKALGISLSYCHNLMLRRYGTLECIDERVVYWFIPDTDEAAKKADEAETYHIKPTTNVRLGDDGTMYRAYILLKGSHEYTREEFSKLVNGLVDECRSLGIETKSKEELDSLLGQWGA